MRLNIYERFIAPISKEPDQAARELVLNYLVAGIFILAVVTVADTTIEFAATQKSYLLSRIAINLITVFFIVGLYLLSRHTRYHKAAAYVLMLLITLSGLFVAYQWGVLDPNDPLLFSLAVVMAGILLGARSALYLTCCIAAALVMLQYAETHNLRHPDLGWVGTKPTAGDVVGFSALLFVIAFVSWLFNRQMEQALRRARRSEKALQQQKALLEVKVEERTRELKASQLEQLQELYRFAELGRLSTALFHDLANHLTNVSLDIEGLQGGEQSAILQRIGYNIRHVDNVVQRVRQQIQGKTTIETFRIIDEVEEVIKLQFFNATKAEVTIRLEASSVAPSLQFKGDVMRFRQILLNLISNAVEAYPAASRDRRSRDVVVQLGYAHKTLTIQVTDHGLGIAAAHADKIFEPFYSTKAKGVGIGLFVVKQVVQQDFKGTINAKSSKEAGTTFTVTLPGGSYAKPARR